MKKTVVGILAHVDAGKTTLSEALLYQTGRIRKLGRVDHQDSFLDNDAQERERGITIFSKQAVLTLPDAAHPETEMTLLDTPGHVDFSSEMERTLQVLDYAVLVISGSDGVQSHTRTLWRLLKRYRIPTFIFINKMDLNTRDRSDLMSELREKLSADCIDLTEGVEAASEDIATQNESMMERFLNDGVLPVSMIGKAVARRELFPCYFGSALKLYGVDRLIQDLNELTIERRYPSAFGAKVFKISHEPSGEKLTFLKVTGGTLSVRDTVAFGEGEEKRESKVNQIRIYSGGKYNQVEKAEAGSVCCVTGLEFAYPGQGLGEEKDSEAPLLDSFLTYEVLPGEALDIHHVQQAMKRLEEEDPQLHVVWNDQLSSLHVQLMGEVQLEVLRRLMMDRFGMAIEFGPGQIVYRETIRSAIEGVGHYEPLRHYAEVHLLLEPLEEGAGLVIDSRCSEDVMNKVYQKAVLTHLSEKVHLGVLTGSPLTDIHISLVGGAGSIKHTVGGDFRQATYRAVRQGLMEAESVLLEPWYDFILTIPTQAVGRAIMDLTQMSAVFQQPQTQGESAEINGYAPVSELQGYGAKVAAYTRGEGALVCMPRGYSPCHNAPEIIEKAAYDPCADLANTPDSVFCSHGAGFTVPWYLVPSYMHLETPWSYLHPKHQAALRGDGPSDSSEADLNPSKEQSSGSGSGGGKVSRGLGGPLAEDKELMAIFERTYGKVSQRAFDKPERPYKPKTEEGNLQKREITEQPKRKEYLLVDGYNVIYSWEDLRKISEISMDNARTKLMDLLSEYKSLHDCTVILVFDAYNVPRDLEDVIQYHNIYVVYTKQAETADTYIEKTTYDIDKRHLVRVVTSDGAEQVIVLGHGSLRVSSREFEEEIRLSHQLFEDMLEKWNHQEKSELTHKGDFDKV